MSRIEIPLMCSVVLTSGAVAARLIPVDVQEKKFAYEIFRDARGGPQP